MSKKALKAGFHRKLYEWYRRHGRHHLPWRQTSDPYAIWVSEVMLQQTQVQTVLERYYFPFLQQFPNIQALAQADLQEVLKHWQGLGYYNRARNLYEAAKLINISGLPQNIEGLIQLPGIGRNTAYAIAAFAYQQPVAIMEANVKRLICRIFALETPTQSQLWQKADELLDTQQPFDYNQAMMDLGALICKPDAPQCPLCPAMDICEGIQNPTAYPARKAKKSSPVRKTKIVLFIDSSETIFIQQRKEKFLHGLWGFPEFAIDSDTAYFDNRTYSFSNMQKIGEIAHFYTHFHLQAAIYLQHVPAVLNGKKTSEIKALPLSRTETKILALLANHKNSLFSQ